MQKRVCAHLFDALADGRSNDCPQSKPTRTLEMAVSLARASTFPRSSPSTSSTVVRRAPVPPELIDKIMKDLVASRASLSSCLLVCRDWARIAYPHHFRKLRYIANRCPMGSTGHKLLGTAPPRSDAHSFEDFLIFLRHVPMVRGCIQELYLGRTDTSPRSVDLDIIEAIIALLPKLQSLTLACRGIILPPIMPRNRPPAGLDRLTLDGTGCTSVTLAALLGLFTSVRRLELEDRIQQQADNSPLISSVSLHLRTHSSSSGLHTSSLFSVRILEVLGDYDSRKGDFRHAGPYQHCFWKRPGGTLVWLD